MEDNNVLAEHIMTVQSLKDKLPADQKKHHIWYRIERRGRSCTLIKYICKVTEHKFRDALDEIRCAVYAEIYDPKDLSYTEISLTIIENCESVFDALMKGSNYCITNFRSYDS